MNERVNDEMIWNEMRCGVVFRTVFFNSLLAKSCAWPTLVNMPLIWTVSETTPLRKKMRLAKPAAVLKSECLKPPYDGAECLGVTSRSWRL